MKCFEQKDYQSNLKNPQSTGGITNYTDSPEKQARLIKKDYEKSGFKILTKEEEIKQKKNLDKDLRNFYHKMTEKYPNLRITRTGSTQYNRFQIGTSMGEQ